MKTIKVIIAGAIFVMSHAVIAATDTNVTVTGVGCGSNGQCFANVTPPISQACNNNNQVRWNGEDSAGRNFTATFLTARASEATVNIGTFDGQCNGNFPVVNFVTLR